MVDAGAGVTFIPLIGDCTTTTTVALAAAHPVGDDPLIVEADPAGGSIAAWFDAPLSPSLSTVVAGVRGADHAVASVWAGIDGLVRRSRSGLRYLPAPVRSVEATRTIAEAEHSVFPTIARSTTALVDVGRLSPAGGITKTIRLADTVIVCHRQATASPGAAGVRLERTAELIDLVADVASRIIVAVIGAEPYELSSIDDYLSPFRARTSFETHLLAVDDLAAAVLAGRVGVSRRRLSRLPLIRTCQRLATLLDDGAGDAEAMVS